MIISGCKITKNFAALQIFSDILFKFGSFFFPELLILSYSAYVMTIFRMRNWVPALASV